MNRRQLLKYASLGTVAGVGIAAAPVLAGGAALCYVGSRMEECPIDTMGLQIKAGVVRADRTIPPSNGGFYFTPTWKEYKTVSFGVGRDGNLWLKCDDDSKWKRVVTE